MKQGLLDTNIVLDLLAGRAPFYPDAAVLFSLADKKKVQFAVSSLSLVNTHYILAKFKSEMEARRILRVFKVLVKVLCLDDKIAELALNSDFRDLEDVIQYYTALENGQELIVSRNLSGFRISELPVKTAGEFIKSMRIN